MIEYERTDISEGIDINKSNKSKECTLCHYWYFLDKNFSYGPHLCDRYYNIIQIQILKILILFTLKEMHTEFIFGIWVNKCKHKRKAISLMTNSNLIDKKVFYNFFK